MKTKLNENWRDIPGFKRLYQVSSLGRIRRLSHFINNRGNQHFLKEKILKTPISTGGYPRFNARKKGRSIHTFVHQAVLLAFIGKPGKGQEGKHLDGNPSNNKLSNLSYGTRSENISDAKRHGTFPVLENRPGAILNRQQALAIFKSKESARKLAKRYRVKNRTVYDIWRKITWASITEAEKIRNRRTKGILHHFAKFTEQQIKFIRRSSLSQRKLARMFNVDKAAIRNVLIRKTWKHIA